MRSGITVCWCEIFSHLDRRYDMLDRRVPGSTTRAVALKTGLDLAVASPVVIFGFMVTYGYVLF
jgi:hypothetical protein